MFSHSDVSDLVGNYGGISHLQYAASKGDNAELIVTGFLSSYLDMGKIRAVHNHHWNVDCSMSTIDHPHSMKASCINEVLDIIGYHKILDIVSHHEYHDDMYSFILNNNCLSERHIVGMVNVGVCPPHYFSTSNPHIPSSFLLDYQRNWLDFPGYVEECDRHLMSDYNKAVNVHMSQDEYMRLADNETLVDELSCNPAIGEEVATKIFMDRGKASEINHAILKSGKVAPSIVDDFHPTLSLERYVSREKINEILDCPPTHFTGSTTFCELVRNDNLDQELLRKMLAKHPMNIDWSDEYIIHIMNKVEDVDTCQMVFDAGRKHMNDEQQFLPFESMFRFRDEVELLSSTFMSARWGMMHSPYEDVALECARKYPQISRLLEHNPFSKHWGS